MSKAVTLLLLLLLICPAMIPAGQPLNVSMIALVANPEKFHGKQIRVIGFLRLEFEGNALYLHEEDYKHGITRNALWVDTKEGLDECGGEQNSTYVLIEGTFRGEGYGQFLLHSGGIEKITRCEWRSKPSDPQSKQDE